MTPETPTVARKQRTINALVLYDVEGWAWWHRARNVSKYAPDCVRVDIAQLGAKVDHAEYDFVLIFEAMCLEAVLDVPRSKLIVGCSCPKLLKELLVLLKRERPAAAIVNNAAMAKVVSREYRCFYCPNGVDEETFVPAPRQPPRPQAAWVGTTRSFVDKGLPLVIEACARSGLPLIALDQREAVGTRRVFTHEQLRDRVYHQATLYLCASEAEGTPNPALEALACGLPVVSTRVGNMPEVIRNGENGFLVDRDVDAIRRAIDEVLGLDFGRVSQAARDSILAGWTWRRQAQNYAAMLQDLASSEAHADARR